ncbi:glycosyl transferase (plasmid) [Embleya sp. NBC_00888]|uniref:glycosyl transferase n=1 Tax=Embleya sp. NBC_00888 TaxID=2975960 RepID=UPI002F910EF0|nr:glycosyl transferase [Embleya sp. NBC_00888]
MAVAEARQRTDPRLRVREIAAQQLWGARAVDWWIGSLFLCLAVWLYKDLWADLDHAYLANGGQDQNMWEWFFDATADAVRNFRDPLVSDLQNHPLGVNMMANTAMLGLGIPLTPVTLLFGPSTTWALVLTGGLAGTAFAWYWLLARRVVRSRRAAAVGGALCGFAPPIISHANAHPNFVVLFVIPPIIEMLIRLWQGERPVRNGVVLGLLIAFQIFIGEEPLLFAAVGLVIFGIVYALASPDAAREAARPLGIGLLVGAAVSLALVAYPLWVQFFGPQHYTTLEHESGNDVAAFTAYASDSLGGDRAGAAALSEGTTEENAFFGWPLVILTLFLVAWLRRAAVARAAAITALVAALLSLGLDITVDHDDTGLPGPWRLLNDLPLFESILESRFALVCVPAIAVLLALATDRILAATSIRSGAESETGSGSGGRELPVQLIWAAVLAMALLPIAPTPLDVQNRRPVPEFFADGRWRPYVDNGSVVVVPLPSVGDATALHWQSVADLGFPLAEGYFVGPWGPDRIGVYGADYSPTSALLGRVAAEGQVPEITADQRREAREDLTRWHADVVVLPEHRYRAELTATLTALLGPGRQVADVQVWDVRHLEPAAAMR